MKVLMFGWEFPPHISGGLGTACYGLTKSLMQEGIQILFVVPRAYGDEELNLVDASNILISEPGRTMVAPETADQLRQTGMELIHVYSGLKPYCPVSSTGEMYAVEEWSYRINTGSSTKPGFIKRKAKKYKFTGSYGPQLLEEVARYHEVAEALAKAHSFDIIHAHDWLTFKAGIAAKEVSGKPLIVHVHATEFDRSQKVDKRIFAIECEGLEKADHIIAVSNWTKRILVTRYNIPEKKISVVHNGMVARKQTFRMKPERISNRIVTFLGRITYQKGPQYFVDAALQVLKKIPTVHFVMAGSGDMLPAMIERVAKLKLSSRFHFTGFLNAEQVARIWSISELYVMPSVSEPFGLAPLEAIHSGVPVIISKQSGVAEVMPHAIQVNFWEVDSLANAMYNVLRHKSLYKTLKKESKKSLQGITWKAAATRINHLYHEVISKQ
jgi:glycogen synthase